ncbi:MAG: AraC family transcriptional regulator [Cyclobacteriaceae bacterium]|nr:AraC family transcriptional regulator [Cyclobacteriaceae bacterium]
MKTENTPIWKSLVEAASTRLSTLVNPAGEVELPSVFVMRVVHFYFCLEGQARLEFGPHYSRELDAKKNFLFYNPETDLPHTLKLKGKTSLVWLSITLEHLHELFIHEPLPFLTPENINRKFYDERDIAPSLLMVLNQLFTVQLSGHARLLFYQGKVLEILSLYFSLKAPDTESCPFLKDDEVVRKIKIAKEHLLKHLEHPPAIRELARLCGLNEYQLKTGFKQIYGNTVYGYLLDHKLDQARVLLDKGRLHVNEVAYQIGYANPSHFIAAFKKRFGITPKKYLMNQR